MVKFTIPRTAQPPLAFDGEIVAEALGRQPGRKPHIRWHDLRLYRTAAGRYVLEIRYETEWEGETGYADAFVLAQDELPVILRNWDPTRYVEGFPPRPEFYERQQRLLEWIESRFRRQAEALAAAAPQEAEEVE